MPQLKGKKKKKKEVEEGAAAGGESQEPGEGKKKGKKKAKKVEGPEFPKMQYGPELTPEQALSTATSWKYNNIIDAKKIFWQSEHCIFLSEGRHFRQAESTEGQKPCLALICFLRPRT